MSAKIENELIEILLVGNYLPDRQESMLRFERALAVGLQARGVVVRRIRPEPILNRAWRGALGKWLGYVDKFLLFPRRLAREARALAERAACRSSDRVSRPVAHILDHSNSVYWRVLDALPWVITCHDLIAVRAARGEFGDRRRPRFTGRVLQRRIAAGLRRARFVVCDSDATRADFERLIERPGRWAPRRIYLGIAPEFNTSGPSTPEFAGALLHVGSGAWYKRRDRVLRIFKRVREHMGSARLVIVGEPFDAGCRRLACELGLIEAVTELGWVSDERLAAIYRSAGALLFPSEAEGFGWPPLEALACGCPAICSDGGSLREVARGPLAFCARSGEGEENEGAMAAAAVRFLKLEPQERSRLAVMQREALAPFDWDRCVGEYIAFYAAIAEGES